MPGSVVLLFASDATLAALGAVMLAALPLFAAPGERRRPRRTRADAVGWVPWTAIFLAVALGAAVLFTLR